MRLTLLILLLASLAQFVQAAPAGGPILLDGFPRSDATAPIAWSSPVAINLDQDAELEIVLGDGGACLWAWNSDGSIVDGYPLTTDPSCDTPAAIQAPLAIGNIDDDQQPEILAGTQGVGPFPNQRGEIWAWNLDGSVVTGWPREMGWNEDKARGIPTITSVVLANAQDDATLEVYYTTNNNAQRGALGVDIAPNAYLRDGTGELIPVYPTWAGIAGIYGAAATTNLTCDTYADLVVGRDHNYLHAYDSTARQPENWPIRTFLDPTRTNVVADAVLAFPRSAPAIGDINGDQQPDIVVAGEIRSSDKVVTGTAITVFQKDGTRLAGWSLPAQAGPPLTTTLEPLHAVALGDLTGDEQLDIVANLPDGTIRSYTATNQPLWTYDYAQEKLLFASEPIIGDITGDGVPEVLFGTYSPDGSANSATGIVALDASGNLVAGFPLSLTAEAGEIHGVRAAPTLADINNDDQLDLLAASIGGTLYAWELGVAVDADALPWPMARHDLWRSGNSTTGNQSMIIPGPHGPFVVFLPLVRRC